VWFGGLREDRLWCEAMVGWRWRRYFQAVGRGCQLWTVDVLDKSDLQFCKLDGKDTLIHKFNLVFCSHSISSLPARAHKLGYDTVAPGPIDFT
jgi:hypothetical protein